MSCLVMYKQRHNNIFDAKSTGLNLRHLDYIGRRSGVLKNENMNHGLFGNIEYRYGARNLQTVKEGQELIKKASDEHKHIYKCIISFDRLQEIKLHLTYRQDWETMLNQEVKTIARANGVELKNMRWIGAVHHSVDHPHCHIMLWDDGPLKVKDNFVDPKIPESIRGKLVKNLYPVEFEEYCQQKNIAKKEFQTVLGAMMDDFENIVEDKTLKQMKQIYGGDLPPKPLKYRNLADKNSMFKITKELYELRKILPTKGRLQYGFLSEEVKGKADDFVQLLLENDPAMMYARNEYINSKMDFLRLYRDIDNESHDEGSFYQGKEKEYTKEADILIANRILKAVKNINADMIKTEMGKRAASEELFESIYNFLTIRAYDDNAADAYIAQKTAKTQNHEYSKQAKKEYIEKNQQGHSW
ncbi:MAG: MobP3 family relaxase [Oscillospiraceae bacterium]